jgi:uncharacterized damage-inducible protein DinB
VTAADLRTLVDYNYWARDRILEAAGAIAADQFTRPMGNSFASIRDTLAHIYSAEWVWYTRWQGESPTKPLSADQWTDLASLSAAWRDLEANVRSFVAGLSDDRLNTVIEYRLLNGQPGRSAFGHMVQHVVNHGTYHRGQVTTLLRQLGAAPPKSTDLITFYRERQG